MKIGKQKMKNGKLKIKKGKMEKKKAIYIESVAIQEAVRYWKYWLMGQKFRVITDHKPLEKLNLKSRPDEELGDIMNYLSQFQFEVVYRPGSDNTEADCLSRNPVLESEDENLEELIRTVNSLQLREIIESQKNIIKEKNDEIENGIIFKRIRNRRRIFLDRKMGEKLTRKLHDEFGHIGSKQLSIMLKKDFYFRNMYRIIEEICSKCEICVKNKSRQGSKFGFMGYLGPASEPFEIMSLDTIGGFGGRRSTKTYLHLLIDHFTRYIYILTSANQTSNEFIRIIESVHCDNKIGTLLTDQYGGLTSNAFRLYLQNEGIIHIFTAIDTASSNGLNERAGQTMVNRIRCRANESENKSLAWTTIAHRCTKEYNNTVHSSTGFSPNYLMNGVIPEVVPKELREEVDFIADRREAFENSKRSHEKNKERIDRFRKERIFDIGEKVYIVNGNKLNRKKLDEIRIGPFEIAERLSKTVYRVKTDRVGSEYPLYHVSKMIPVD
jgi:transposase InsO family protein